VDRLIELSRIYDSVIEDCISVEAANTAFNCIPEWRTWGLPFARGWWQLDDGAAAAEQAPEIAQAAERAGQLVLVNCQAAARQSFTPFLQMCATERLARPGVSPS